MLSLSRPEVILTHESDLDGLLSGLLCQHLARHLFEAEIPVCAYNNHSWRQRQPIEGSAWVCDFAFEPRLDRAGWVVIDHHPFDTSPQQTRLIHDPAKSAAALCYDLCQEAGIGSDRLTELVHLSDVADLFHTQDPDFVIACDYASLVKTYGFNSVVRLIDSNPEQLLNHPLLEVMRARRLIEDPLGLAWSRNHLTPLPDGVGLVDIVVGNSNLIVHELLEKANLPQTTLITLGRRGTANFVASLRSRNGEALRIAQRLKGGGHPNAAGASLPRSVQSLDSAIEYLRQALAPLPPRAASVPGGDTTRGLFEQAGF